MGLQREGDENSARASHLIRYVFPYSFLLRKIEGKSLRFPARPSISVDVNQRMLWQIKESEKGSFFTTLQLYTIVIT